MVKCESCDARNSLDSRFCRSCGVAFDPAALTEARRVADLAIVDGQRLYGEGRNVESLAVARQILAEDPDCTAALALLGDCLEKDGDFGEALNAYEKVIVLNPDSVLDRIRVSQLRKKCLAAEGPVRRPRSDRRTALVSGVAAAVVVLASGTGIVLASRTPAAMVDTLAMASTDGDSLRPFVSSPVPKSSGQGSARIGAPLAAEGQDASTASDVRVPASGTVPGTIARSSRSVVGQASSGRNNIPVASSDGGYRPVDPFTVTPETAPAATSIGSASTSPDEPRPVEVKDPAKETRRPVIDIRPSDRNATNVGGSRTADEDSANESNALVRVGRQHYQSGDFPRAASAYERALRRGSDPSTTNQRLAQSYEKMGRKAEAAGAYRKAAQAYEDKLKKGQGDRKLLESQVEGCKQAAKLLGG